jgi:hypothetical protein
MSPQSGAVSVVAVADDALFLEHVAPQEHPERGERLLAVRAGLERAAVAAGPRGATFASGKASQEEEDVMEKKMDLVTY